MLAHCGEEREREGERRSGEASEQASERESERGRDITRAAAALTQGESLDVLCSHISEEIRLVELDMSLRILIDSPSTQRRESEGEISHEQQQR